MLEHSRATRPLPRPAHDSEGFDLDNLGAAELEDAVLWHLLAGGECGLRVPAAPEQGSILLGLGKLPGGQCLHLQSGCWPGVALGRGEGGMKVGLGSRLEQGGVRVGSSVIRARHGLKFGDGAQSGPRGPERPSQDYG